jgi:hypothetical protein
MIHHEILHRFKPMNFETLLMQCCEEKHRLYPKLIPLDALSSGKPEVK